MVKNSAEQCKQGSKEGGKKKKKTQVTRLPQNHKKACLEFQQDNNYKNLIVTWLQPLKILNYPCLAYIDDKWP